MAHEYRFGIEEEYFLADAQTCGSPQGDAPQRFHKAAADAIEPASHELLVSQIEVQTGPGASLDEAEASLRDMRRKLSAIAADQGLALFAAGSHPIAVPERQQTTEKERYTRITAEFGLIARRSMVCAMHIHVEVPDAGVRTDLMNRMLPFLPLCFALSTSSPFWEGDESGLKSFRLAAFREWPRMGLPEIFSSDADYDRFVERLVSAKVMTDASFVWWLIRPSTRFPTIELRICDSCTRAEDAVAIAALYRCLLRMLVRRPDVHAGMGPVERALTTENIWQAQQNGIGARFIDIANGAMVPIAVVLESALALVAEDADALGCSSWVERTRAILGRGTSADQQIAVYGEAKQGGATGEDALRPVVRMLAQTTVL